MMFNVAVFLGLVISVIECGPVTNRRDAFDPEQLMTHYMDMRTNQGLFGSYHPNDLVKSIVDYFNRGGPQSMNSNQWGLVVYNPNDKMGQYIGNMESPGNLGPESKENVNEENDVKPEEGSAFNPNTLNEMLMQNAFKKGNQFSNVASPAAQDATKGQGNLGFDADALNRQMMESTMSKAGTNDGSAQETTTQPTGTGADENTGNNVVQAPAGQMLGFNPDILNAGLLNSLPSHGVANGGSYGENKDQGQTRAMTLGFNPDRLNAGLISSLSYNPNSAMGKMPAYNGHGAMFGEMVHGAESKDNQAVGGSTSHGNLSGSSTLTSAYNGMGGVNGGTVVSNNSGQPGGNTGVAEAGSGNSVQNEQGSMSSMYSANQSGAVSASGGTMGSFSAGGIGPQGSGNQNSAMPPGVPAGTVLHQTDSATAKVHGIGGMG